MRYASSLALLVQIQGNGAGWCVPSSLDGGCWEMCVEGKRDKVSRAESVKIRSGVPSRVEV